MEGGEDFLDGAGGFCEEAVAAVGEGSKGGAGQAVG